MLASASSFLYYRSSATASTGSAHDLLLGMVLGLATAWLILQYEIRQELARLADLKIRDMMRAEQQQQQQGSSITIHRNNNNNNNQSDDDEEEVVAPPPLPADDDDDSVACRCAADTPASKPALLINTASPWHNPQLSKPDDARALVVQQSSATAADDDDLKQSATEKMGSPWMSSNPAFNSSSSFDNVQENSFRLRRPSTSCRDPTPSTIDETLIHMDHSNNTNTTADHQQHPCCPSPHRLLIAELVSMSQEASHIGSFPALEVLSQHEGGSTLLVDDDLSAVSSCSDSERSGLLSTTIADRMDGLIRQTVSDILDATTVIVPADPQKMRHGEVDQSGLRERVSRLIYRMIEMADNCDGEDHHHGEASSSMFSSEKESDDDDDDDDDDNSSAVSPTCDEPADASRRCRSRASLARAEVGGGCSSADDDNSVIFGGDSHPSSCSDASLMYDNFRDHGLDSTVVAMTAVVLTPGPYSKDGGGSGGTPLLYAQNPLTNDNHGSTDDEEFLNHSERISI